LALTQTCEPMSKRKKKSARKRLRDRLCLDCGCAVRDAVRCPACAQLRPQHHSRKATGCLGCGTSIRAGTKRCKACNHAFQRIKGAGGPGLVPSVSAWRELPDGTMVREASAGEASS
jgi:rubredoxin